MPTMVMSQPPKVSGDTSLRKRQKTKNDNIVAISYMYVGTPKRKFIFYVRERLVYRPNVEVTFEEVFNFLSNGTNDETITLHYSVNGQYVPITTTGQLHTFLRHVHNDPAVFLYVENQDYVWNVTPNDNSHKMEKRVPAGGAATTDEDGDPYDSMEDEDEEEEGGDGTEETCCQDDDCKQPNESEEEIKLTSPLTSDKAPVVYAEKIQVKEAFEPKPRGAQTAVGNMQSGTKSGGTSKDPKKGQAQDNLTKEVRLPNKKWTTKQAYIEMKTIFNVAHAKNKMRTIPDEISEKLVLNIWNPDYPLDKQVYKDTVSLLRKSISMGVLCYYHKLFHKEDPTKEFTADSVEKLPVRKTMPPHDHEFLLDFVEGSIIIARDILESFQNLAHLQIEFDYFNKLNKLIVEKANGQELLPFIHELGDHLKNAVTSAHYGFNILKPLFPSGCECKEAIRLVTLDLQKLLCVINNSKQKTCSPQLIQETKLFIVETAHKIIKRFTEKECPKHDTIERALGSSESSKWHDDLHHGYDEWTKLLRENRPNVPEKCYDVGLYPPGPFSVKLDGAINDTNVAASASNSTPAATSKNSTSAPPSSSVDKATAAMENLSTKEKEEVKQSDQTARKQVNNTPAPATKPPTSTTNAPSTTTSTGDASSGGAAVISKKMSPELQAMIDKMYKSVPTQHNYVYPAQPKPGAILIPTGGLARCRCSKNCPEFLMEPAYEYMERFNEPRQTVWEKTKQKRFKKN